MKILAGTLAADAGMVIRNGHQESLRFLKQVEKAYPRVDLHVVADILDVPKRSSSPPTPRLKRRCETWWGCTLTVPSNLVP